MTKTLSFLFFILLFVSCGKSGGGSDSSAKSGGDSVSAEEVQVGAPVPSAALNFDVNLKLDNFNAEQEDKILTAADLIKKVVGSEEFKDAILNHTYKGKKTFVDNGGKSNAEIYAQIIEGQESLRPGQDNEMDLDLEVFTRNDDTVGYTYPTDIRVWMNAKFLNKNTAAKVTTNMMHEWLHKLGFKHSHERTAARPYSVPYAIGYLVAKLAQQMS
jgi:hypothetical protein